MWIFFIYHLQPADSGGGGGGLFAILGGDAGLGFDSNLR
jgi:hypothetical protein